MSNDVSCPRFDSASEVTDAFGPCKCLRDHVHSVLRGEKLVIMIDSKTKRKKI